MNEAMPPFPEYRTGKGPRFQGDEWIVDPTPVPNFILDLTGLIARIEKIEKWIEEQEKKG